MGFETARELGAGKLTVITWNHEEDEKGGSQEKIALLRLEAGNCNHFAIPNCDERKHRTKALFQNRHS